MNKEILKNYTILYVEDDADVRKVAVEYLSRICKEVLEAENGKEALNVWRDENPDIIITDISMPKMNGIDMARYIRAEDLKTPIIVATAYTDQEYLLKAVELQLVKYIVKPITKDKLMGALELSLQRMEDKSKFSLPLSESCAYNAFSKEIICDGEPVKLTKNELLFLDLLAFNSSRVVTYEEIESQIWPYEGMSSDAIRSLVRALRKKLPDDTIDNISGIGYKINVYTND
jgi:two-component system response regulator VanR